MKLDFEYLDIVGFRSFSTPALFQLNRRPGLYHIQGENRVDPLGSNGAGKSSIWGALCWVPYGQTPGGLKTTDVTPWYTGVVGANVSIGGKVAIRYKGHTYIDNKTVGADELQKLFGGMSFHVFTNTVLLGQGRPLFLDLKPEARLKLFVEVLGLDRWDDYIAKAKAEHDEFAAEVERCVAEEARATTRLEEIEGQLVVLQQRSLEWQEERRTRDDRRKAEVDELQRRLDVQQRFLDDATLKLDGAGTELQAIQRELAQVEQDLRVVQQNYDDFLQDQRSAERQIELLRHELEHMQAGGTCPTCGQALPQRTERQRATLRRKIAEAEDTLPKVPQVTITKLDKFQRKYDTLIESERNFARMFDDAQVKVNQYGPEVAALQARIHALNEARDEHASEADPYVDQMQLLRRTKRELEASFQVIDKQMQLAQRRAARKKFWYTTGFKEARLLRIEGVLDQIELIANAMLPEIGLPDWSLKFAIERENKTAGTTRGILASVFSPDNSDWVRWEVWSGGEAQRLRIVAALAMADVLLAEGGIETNLEVLDEPTAGLSPEGIDDVIEFLANRAQDLRRQIYFTDQHSMSSGLFAGSILVVKDETGSWIDISVDTGEPTEFASGATKARVGASPEIAG